jgi:antitoxin (DNA-binding transcriptional repressor) of toxin-antitoxin stability system
MPIRVCTQVYTIPDTLKAMASIGMRELRSALATYIRRAQMGERVVVTVDGAPVAQISAVGADFAGVTMADLVARGAVTSPRRRDDWVSGEPLVLYSGARIDRALSQVRA